MTGGLTHLFFCKGYLFVAIGPCIDSGNVGEVCVKPIGNLQDILRRLLQAV